MSFGGGSPAVPDLPPAAPPAPTPVDPAIREIRNKTRAKQQSARGIQSTIATSAQGLGGTEVAGAKKTLLGV